MVPYTTFDNNPDLPAVWAKTVFRKYAVLASLRLSAVARRARLRETAECVARGWAMPYER